jgi:hypothetical protein
MISADHTDDMVPLEMRGREYASVEPSVVLAEIRAIRNIYAI